MAAETFRIEIPINVQDNTDPGVSNATRKMGAFDKANQKAQERLDKMNKTKYQLIINALDKAGPVIDRVWSGAKRLGGRIFTVTFKGIDLVTRPFRGIIRGIMSPISTMLGIAGGIGIASLISGFVETAGRADTLNVAMEAVAKSTGTSMKMLNEHKKSVMELGIAEQEAAQVLTRFMQSELDTAQAAKIARIAQDAAVIAGQNSSEATETMVEAVAKLRPELLSQFGMTKNLNAIYTDYAKQAGIVVTTTNKYGKEVRHMTRELTEAEKKQAMLNYIIEEGEKIAGTYEKAMDSPFKKMGSLVRYVQTFSTSIGRMVILPAFGKLVDGTTALLKAGIEWAEMNEDKLSRIGEDIATSADKWMGRVRRTFGSKEFQDADFMGKISIAWNKIIAEPFGEWWESTGRPWFAGKAESIGKGIGTGITSGLLLLLGIDVETAVTDGASIGSSFAKGFTEGFDGEKVGKAILTAIGNVFKDAGKLLPGGEKPSGTSWLSAGAIMLALQKLGIFKLIGKGAGMLGRGSKGGLPGAGGPFTATTATMQVTAQVVNVFGSMINAPGGGGMPGGGGVPGGPVVVPGTPSLPGGETPALPGGSGPLALPGPASGGAAAAGKGINMVQLKDGTWVAAGGAIKSAAATLGVKLGSGAATAGGAAAAGAAGVAGGIVGVLGLGSAGIDVYQGFKKKKAGDAKGAKDEFVTAGTKTGLVAAGAGVGAAIGSVVPVAGTAIGALVGAGVGGLAALFGGDKLGKAISDATDKSDKLTKTWGDTESSGVAAATATVNAWERAAGRLEKGAWKRIRAGSASLYDLGALDRALQGGPSKPSEGSHRMSGAMAHAWGGILTKPHIGMVAEDGAESVIPLSPDKRARGLDLWQQTGTALGVKASTGTGGQGVVVQIDIKAEPKVVIEGGGGVDEEAVASAMRGQIRGMADDIGDEIAERLTRVFANMPVKGGVG